MKKIVTGLLAAIAATSVYAQSSVSYDVGSAKDYVTGATSNVQYLRGNIGINEKYTIGLLSRTQRYTTDQYVVNAFEATVKRTLGNAYVGVGAGHDAGPRVDYSIITAGYFLPVGGSGGGAFVGGQHNNAGGKRDHAIGWIGYSIPVAKNVFINPTYVRNWGDFKENEYTLGVSYNF